MWKNHTSLKQRGGNNTAVLMEQRKNSLSTNLFLVIQEREWSWAICNTNSFTSLGD